MTRSFEERVPAAPTGIQARGAHLGTSSCSRTPARARARGRRGPLRPHRSAGPWGAPNQGHPSGTPHPLRDSRPLSGAQISAHWVWRRLESSELERDCRALWARRPGRKWRAPGRLDPRSAVTATGQGAGHGAGGGILFRVLPSIAPPGAAAKPPRRPLYPDPAPAPAGGFKRRRRGPWAPRNRCAGAMIP